MYTDSRGSGIHLHLLLKSKSQKKRKERKFFHESTEQRNESVAVQDKMTVTVIGASSKSLFVLASSSISCCIANPTKSIVPQSWQKEIFCRQQVIIFASSSQFKRWGQKDRSRRQTSRNLINQVRVA